MPRRSLPAGVPRNTRERPGVYRAWGESELAGLVKGTPGWGVEIIAFQNRRQWRLQVSAPSGEARVRDLDVISSEREVCFAVRSLYEELVR